ncbi:Wnt inhibitory factor 1, partial [Durusdinium trenchii]
AVPLVNPLAHVFLREVRQLPLPSGTRDSMIHLVDEATAEKGVRRKYYDRLPGLFQNHSRTAGYDVPYINQFQSPYDAAHFESYLRPELGGNYTLSVEVLGAFVLTWEDRILLAGLLSETFNAMPLELNSTFYFFHLEYWADPLLPERIDQEMLTFPRRIRFLWSGPAGDMQPVPYTELYHSFDEVYGYPITAHGVNDPNPCDSENTVSVTGLLEGENGTIIDGTIGYNYNEDLTCSWLLEATGNVRFTVFVNFFDVVDSVNCAGRDIPTLN